VALTGLSDPASTEANGAENTSDADGEGIALQH
jgi:hypothetical protein